MLNNYIDEKTKDIEIQRNQVINDNNLIENFDIDNNNINIEKELVEENIKNITKMNNKAKLRIQLTNDKNKNGQKNKYKTEINMFRKEYDKKNKTTNNNEGNKKIIFGDKKNITGSKLNTRSSNMNKNYKIEGEIQKKNPVFIKKNEEKKIQQRSRSLIPKVKLPAKSSEVKIKYSVKERKMNNNIKKSSKMDNTEDDPLNKLQNIQKYIKGILNEYKEK